MNTGIQFFQKTGEYETERQEIRRKINLILIKEKTEGKQHPFRARPRKFSFDNSWDLVL